MKIRLNQIARLRQRYGVFLSKRPIFVYQMGKVGSTAIEEGLRESGVPVCQLHSIGWHIADQFRLRRGGRSLTSRWRRRVQGAVQGLLLKVPNHRVKVISLVREPLARNISGFFQGLRRIMWNDTDFDTRDERGGEQFLVESFYKHVRQEVPALWFDREIRYRLGIDVYQHPFDHEHGWTLIREGNVDLLLIRSEDLDRCEAAIGSFAGMPDFKLKNTNCGDRKWYAPLYRSFRSTFRPTPELLDRLYDTRYMRHFYTTKEITGFRNRWLSVRGSAPLGETDNDRAAEVPGRSTSRPLPVRSKVNQEGLQAAFP